MQPEIQSALAKCNDPELRNTFIRAIAAQRKFEIRLFSRESVSNEPEKK
jgi:hypothetical protein